MDICRVCESKEIYVNLIEKSNKKTLNKLKAFANIQFDPNDCLPKYICKKCILDLDFAYKFKIQCEYTDQKLRYRLEIPKHNEVQKNVVESKETLNFPNGTSIEQIKDDPENIVVPFSAGEYIAEEEEVDDLIENQPIECKTIKIDHVDILDEISEELIDWAIKPIEITNEFEEDLVENKKVFTDADEDTICNQSQHTIEHSAVSIEKKIEKLTTLRINRKYGGKNGKTIRKIKHYTCDTCNDIFDGFVKFNEHKKSHGKQRYQCPDCNKWFAKRCKMTEHQTIHQNKQFPCNLCIRCYTNQGNLNRHISEFHKKERKYICHICNRTCSQLTSLKQHLLTHTEDRPYECDLCHKSFKSKSFLNLHAKRHSPSYQLKQTFCKGKKSAERTYICEFCGKISNACSTHLTHMRTHKKEKSYECFICKKRFTIQPALRKHMLIHTGERPYKCDVCQLAFRQYGHLQSHKLIHSDVRPHKCLICMKSFKLRGALTVHMRLHTGNKPYDCAQCSQKFIDVTALKRHKLTHTKQIKVTN